MLSLYRYYRAPELIFGAMDYTTMIDVWSQGCVFAELLIGSPLFPGSSGIDQLVEIIKVRTHSPLTTQQIPDNDPVTSDIGYADQGGAEGHEPQLPGIQVPPDSCQPLGVGLQARHQRRGDRPGRQDAVVHPDRSNESDRCKIEQCALLSRLFMLIPFLFFLCYARFTGVCPSVLRRYPRTGGHDPRGNPYPRGQFPVHARGTDGGRRYAAGSTVARTCAAVHGPSPYLHGIYS